MIKLMFAMFAAVLAGVANAEICIKNGDASLPPIRLNAAKIPGCSKAHVCNDLQYGGRQLGKGTKDANSARRMHRFLLARDSMDRKSFAKEALDLLDYRIGIVKNLTDSWGIRGDRPRQKEG